ncbi:hypothetical protein [Roseobacter cerasinus]|nr:hypothetical protein [Roseobacter cerasinus]
MALATAVPTLVWAQGRAGFIYECDMRTSKSNEFWISSKIGIVLLKDGSVVVSDGVSIHYPGGTAKAAVRENSDSTMRLDWRLEGGLAKSQGREFILLDAEYSATLDKASNQIRVRARLPEYRKRFSGSGTCKIRKK